MKKILGIAFFGCLLSLSVFAQQQYIDNVSGWRPQFQARTDTPVLIDNLGTGNVVNDIITINDGCSPHVSVIVTSINSKGGVTGASISNPGLCSAANPNYVGQASTTGHGKNSTFQFLYQPLAILSGWSPTFGVQDSSTSTPFIGGVNNAVGDVLTLNDGCSTHATIVVQTVATGAVTKFAITNRGTCSAIPPNPVFVSSSTGSGTGTAFWLSWAPIASNISLGSLPINGGNTYITNPQFSPQPGLYGNENTFIGYAAGAAFTGNSNFNTAVGHNACGLGGGAPFAGSSNTCIGTDSGRNLIGGSGITAIGTSALHDESQSGVNSLTAVGQSAMEFENNGNSSNHSASLGDSSCIGVFGSGNFRDGLCLGSITGAALTTAFNFTIIGTGVGNTTFASGHDVVLIGSGDSTVDTPTATTIHYTNINNAIVAVTAPPTIQSGFGTSPSIVNGTSSAAFQINVGTGGTATSGVINFGTNISHGFACYAIDGTNPASFVTVVTPATIATVTITNYSRTTGLLAAWTASDILTVSCNGF